MAQQSSDLKPRQIDTTTVISGFKCFPSSKTIFLPRVLQNSKGSGKALSLGVKGPSSRLSSASYQASLQRSCPPREGVSFSSPARPFCGWPATQAHSVQFSSAGAEIQGDKCGLQLVAAEQPNRTPGAPGVLQAPRVLPDVLSATQVTLHEVFKGKGS